MSKLELRFQPSSQKQQQPIKHTQQQQQQKALFTLSTSSTTFSIASFLTLILSALYRDIEFYLLFIEGNCLRCYNFGFFLCFSASLFPCLLVAFVFVFHFFFLCLFIFAAEQLIFCVGFFLLRRPTLFVLRIFGSNKRGINDNFHILSQRVAIMGGQEKYHAFVVVHTTKSAQFFFACLRKKTTTDKNFFK